MEKNRMEPVQKKSLEDLSEDFYIFCTELVEKISTDDIETMLNEFMSEEADKPQGITKVHMDLLDVAAKRWIDLAKSNNLHAQATDLKGEAREAFNTQMVTSLLRIGSAITLKMMVSVLMRVARKQRETDEN